MTQIYDFKAITLQGEDKHLSDYKGKTLLIVNVASKCGFTPQYKGLEQLYQDYKEQGFEILGFPCNQFGAQEPGSSEEIQSFCTLTYQVSFPIFEKIEVNGKNTHPLYSHIKAEAPGLLGTQAIKWNFTKFLVDKKGRVVTRFASADTPKQIEKSIKSLL